MDTSIEPRTTPKLVADRSLDELRFGSAWKPSLGELMPLYPHSDDEFVLADHMQVCKTCGRSPGAPEHVIEMSVSLIRRSEMVAGAHDFESRGPFTPEEVEEARAEWRKRVAELPTDAALNAWQEVHAGALGRLRQLLDQCEVKTAADIEKLGCTGCYQKGLSLNDIQFLRVGLAGSGVGLPCFVPPSLFCLGHEVTGGLQEFQEPQHNAQVPAISRALSPSEQAQGKLVDQARQSERGAGEAFRLLRGHTLPADWHNVDDEPTNGTAVEAAGFTPLQVTHVVAAAWKCQSHSTTDWKCRWCVAQAIIDGPLETIFAVEDFDEKGEQSFSTGGSAVEIEREITDADTRGSSRLIIYVRAATYTRKLSRDDP